MSSPIKSESRALLEAYQRGKKTDAELEEWLVQAEYDDDMGASERDALARVRLFLIEAGEGMRPKKQLLDEIANLLARSPRRRISRVKSES